MSIPADKSAGDELSAAEMNLLRDLGFIVDQNAGETINGGTLPVAVYWDNADDEWKACDGDDTGKVQFAGFAISNSTDGNPINVQFIGRVGGFSGLTVGANYYVQDDKTIGTSLGAISIFVGIAISATEILIKGNGAFVDLFGIQMIAGKKIFSTLPEGDGDTPSTANQLTPKDYVDTQITTITPVFNRGKTTGTAISDVAVSDTVITHGLGAVPKLIVVRTFPSVAGSKSASFGSAKTDGVSSISSEGCSYLRAAAVVYTSLANKIAAYSNNGANVVDADLIAVSGTTFTIRFASAGFSGAAGTPLFDWEVYR